MRVHLPLSARRFGWFARAAWTAVRVAAMATAAMAFAALLPLWLPVLHPERSAIAVMIAIRRIAHKYSNKCTGYEFEHSALWGKACKKRVS
jgi:hypothetical protein